MTRIAAGTLRERQDTSDDLCLVDRRPVDDYTAGSIDGSRNIPVRDDLLAGDLTAVRERLDTLPDDQEVVLLCDAGIASHELAELLTKQEREGDVKALDGGL